jgi:signal transduction histidine kinase
MFSTSPWVKSETEEYIFKHDKTYFNRQLKSATTFALIGMVIFPIYTVINLYLKDYQAAILELIALFLITISFYDVKKNKRLFPGLRLGIAALMLVLWQNFYSSGFDNTGVLWLYFWPLGTFLIGGAKRAFFVNFIFLSGVLVIFALSKFGIFVQHYSDLTVLMIFLSLVIFSSITRMIQQNIEKYVTNQIKQRVKIKELDIMRDKFIDIVSTQLQNPLNAIKWNSELLIEDLVDEDFRGNVVDIYNSSTTVIDRISDMTHAIDISETDIIVDIEEFNIRPIIKKNVSDLHRAFPLRTVNVNFSNYGQKIAVNSDKKKVSVILNAIIDNAFRYTRGKEKVSINVFKHTTKDKVVISISDNGIGIPKKEKHKVFDLFYRASNANKANPYGTGVGLFVAKNYANKLGIKIKLRSSMETGTDVDILI